MTLSVIIGQSFKGIVHPKMETIVIYAPSSCSKLVWVSFFCWTKEEVLKIMFGNQTDEGPHWPPWKSSLNIFLNLAEERKQLEGELMMKNE